LIKAGSTVRKGDLLWKGYDTIGDHLFIEKVSYHFRKPKRGEIIVFRTNGIKELVQNNVYTMRVAGLPGERIKIKPPFLYVNGEKVTAPEIFTTIASRIDGYGGYEVTGFPRRTGCCLSSIDDEITLGPDEYFVLGDNSKNSYDSRYWGPVPGKNIFGRVTRIYWPFSRINALEGMQ